MKKKININRPEISSDEILKRKNFESVLKQHTPMSKPLFKNPWFFSGALVVVVAVAVATFLLKNNDAKLTNPVTADSQTLVDSVALADFYAQEEAKPCVNPPLAEINVPTTIYKVNAEKGATLEFKTGSKITIPKNSFVDGNGKLVKGDVELHYREFHDPVDFFVAGIPMTYDSAGVRYHFESAGMMEMNAYQGNEKLAVAPEKSINIALASNYSGTKYNLYKLDTAVNNWACLGKDKVVSVVPKSAENFDDKTPNSVAETPEYKTIETKKETLLQEKEVKLTALPKLSKEPLKPQEAKKNKYTFDLDVDAKEYPELAVYKDVMFEVGAENKNFNSSMYDVTWDEALIKEGADKGKNYMLSLKKASKQYDLVVYPVFEGKNYEKALAVFQEKFTKYTSELDKRKVAEAKVEQEYQAVLAKLKQQQQELERRWKEREENQFKLMSNQEKVQRLFAVNGFGIYNCDNPLAYPTGITCKAKLNGENDKRINCYNVYLVDKAKNGIFTYAKNPVVNFSFNPASENILWTVESGVLYWLKPEQFSGIEKNVPVSAIKMNKVEQKFKNIDEMKAFFNI